MNDAAAATVGSSSVLSILLLCGLMGLISQGARAAVGLKAMTIANAPTHQAEFNAAYLVISLMIGFIAGILAGLSVGLSNFEHIDLNHMTFLLGIAAAGYAGTDFIENSLSLFVPPAPKQPAQPVGPPLSLLPPDQTPAQAGVAVPQRLPPQQPAIAPTADVVPGLTTAFQECAPRVDTAIWVPVLSAAFARYDFNTNRRMAAAIGQFLVEAGPSFREVVEDLRYTTAARICQVFPEQFPTADVAESCVDNPVALANRAYAGRNGNGDEASGDGYRFRGRGLIQLTGRTIYTEFGTTVDMTAEQAARYCETPAGAAMSGCWYLASKGCLPLADVWALSQITRKVNGAAMLGNAQRIADADAFLQAFGG